MSAPVDVLAMLRQIANGEGDTELLAMRCHAAIAELIGKVEQIERLSRTANPKLVNVPAMLGDIARAAIRACGGA